MRAPKKVTKEEGNPLPRFSFGLSAATGAAAELALSALKQSSPPAICRSSLRRDRGLQNHTHAYAFIIKADVLKGKLDAASRSVLYIMKILTKNPLTLITLIDRVTRKVTYFHA